MYGSEGKSIGCLLKAIFWYFHSVCPDGLNVRAATVATNRPINLNGNNDNNGRLYGRFFCTGEAWQRTRYSRRKKHSAQCVWQNIHMALSFCWFSFFFVVVVLFLLLLRICAHIHINAARPYAIAALGIPTSNHGQRGLRSIYIMAAIVSECACRRFGWHKNVLSANWKDNWWVCECVSGIVHHQQAWSTYKTEPLSIRLGFCCVSDQPQRQNKKSRHIRKYFPLLILNLLPSAGHLYFNFAIYNFVTITCYLSEY